MTIRNFILLIASLSIASLLFGIGYLLRADISDLQKSESKATYYRESLRRTQSIKVFSTNQSGPDDDEQIAYLVPADIRFGRIMDELHKCLSEVALSAPKGAHLSGPLRFELRLDDQETLEIRIKVNAIQFGDDSFFLYDRHDILSEIFIDELMRSRNRGSN